MSPTVQGTTVKRRRVLRATGALAAGGLGGCVGASPGSPGGGDGDSTDPGPSDGDGGSPSDLATSFAVSGSRCGNQTNEASVTFGDGRVTVDGTIWGNDACYTGHLESATLVGGTLTIRVVAERPRGEDVGCAQCITEIDYRATVETPSTPEEVVVVHRDETVATASP